MESVDSLGGPRVLLPTSQVNRFMAEVGDEPSPDAELYGLACDVNGFCGVIEPWGTPLLIFGDSPSPIHFDPDFEAGLFFRWEGADDLESLHEFAKQQARLADPESAEVTEFTVHDPDMTLMDTCAFEGDRRYRLKLTLRKGVYLIFSHYADSDDVMTIFHRLKYLG